MKYILKNNVAVFFVISSNVLFIFLSLKKDYCLGCDYCEEN